MSIYLYTFASLHSQPSPTTAPSWPSPKWTDWTWAPISASPPMASRQQSASVWCSLCTVSIWGGAGPSILAYLNIYSSAPGSGTASCSWDQVGRMQGAGCREPGAPDETTAENTRHSHRLPLPMRHTQSPTRNLAMLNMPCILIFPARGGWKMLYTFRCQHKANN